jgi:hypothetical protein
MPRKVLPFDLGARLRAIKQSRNRAAACRNPLLALVREAMRRIALTRRDRIATVTTLMSISRGWESPLAS